VFYVCWFGITFYRDYYNRLVSNIFLTKIKRKQQMSTNNWTLDLEAKPDFDIAMKRIYAWYEHEMIDRPPIRFSAHNAEFAVSPHLKKSWTSLKDRWLDSENQVDLFIDSIRGRKFYAETFPVFWPNLGPEVYTAFHGSELEYMEITTYTIPLVKEWEDISKIKFDWNNPYLKKIEEMTRIALEKCKGKFMVGYTDLHPGMDCVAAWRDPQQLCLDVLIYPDEVKQLIKLANQHFQELYDYFDTMLKNQNQLSVAWMGIPSFGKMHIPSCDFSAMVSPEQFDEFCLPVIVDEVKAMTHNIFHLDGKGVAKNIDRILDLQEINAIQWVQGMGDDAPILQWIPFIKRIQDAGKSVVVDLQLNELDDFINEMDPKGLLLCIAADEKIQPDIIKQIEKW
jgi:hypothetical protein